LASWISKRYFREAFPNAFEERLRKGESLEKIREVLKRHGEDLTGIYLLVSNEELPEAEAYEITVKATMGVDAFEVADKRTKCQEAIGAIAGLMRACSGIEVFETEVVPESSVTLDDLHFLKRWDCDDLSLRGDGEYQPQR
jgi:hypothetical protein